MAVAHSMIIVGYYLIKYDLKFNDLGADFFDRRNRSTLPAVRSND